MESRHRFHSCPRLGNYQEQHSQFTAAAVPFPPKLADEIHKRCRVGILSRKEYLRVPVSFPAGTHIPVRTIKNIKNRLISQIRSSYPDRNQNILFFPDSVQPFQPQPLFCRHENVFI